MAALISAVSVRSVSAENQQSQRNVYEAFSESASKTEGSLDEITTSKIKRYMASLLYPVDLSTFARPEKDQTFRTMVAVLQRQMGENTTGVLTLGQFESLKNAAADIDDRMVSVAPKFVSRGDEGNIIVARGTGRMSNIAHPINTNRLLCVKSEHTCEMSGANFDDRSGLLSTNLPTVFRITSWTPSQVVAVSENGCGKSSLLVDLLAEDVTITTTPQHKLSFCSDEPTNVWRLADGSKIVWNFYCEKYNRARELVYPLAKRLFPVRALAE